MKSKIDIKKLIFLIIIVSVILVGSISLIINYVENNTNNDNITYSASSFHINGNVSFNRDENDVVGESSIYALNFNQKIDAISYNIFYNLSIGNTFNLNAGIHIYTNVSLYDSNNSFLDSLLYNDNVFPKNMHEIVYINHTFSLIEFEDVLYENVKGLQEKFYIIVSYNIITYRSTLEKVEYTQTTMLYLNITNNNMIEFLNNNTIEFISPIFFLFSLIGILFIINKRKNRCVPFKVCNPYRDKCCNSKKNNMNIF